VILTARDQHYSIAQGGNLSVNAAEGVMSNDDLTEGAYSELLTEPEHGVVTFNADGSFVYTATGAVGVDQFTYRLTDGVSSDEATVTISIHPTATTGSNGFTPIVPSEDSLIIYVSSTDGDDSNDCLNPESPCETTAAGARKMREGYPDHMYLKRGDVWRQDGLSGIPSGRSIDEPAVVAFYGESGPRPRLENYSVSILGRRRYMTEDDPQWQGGDGGRKIFLSYVHIIGLEFYNYRLDPNHPEFTGGNASATINMIDDYDYILFEDNKFNFAKVNAHKFGGFEQTYLTFRRNIWNGYYVNTSSYTQDPRPSNIYAGVDGLQMIENVVDHGGWHPTVKGAGANMYNHNIYLQGGNDGKDIVLRGNIITRGSSHGAQMRSGGVAENNFFGRNAISLLIGYKDPVMFDGVAAHAINNVVSEGHSMIKGHDACNYNNACSRALMGIDLSLSGGNADWQAHDNIISKLAADDNAWRDMWDARHEATWEERYQLSITSLTEDDAIYSTDNIIWKWNLSPGEPEHSYPDPERTLADYNAHLGGARSFDAFMQVVLNRPLQTWDERYSAYAINDFIREGFGR